MLSEIQSSEYGYVTTIAAKEEHSGMWWTSNEPKKPLPGILSISPEGGQFFH